MVVPRFHVPGLRAGDTTCELPADEAHHLRHVLRLGDGAEVRVFDGAGHEWSAVVQLDRRTVRVALGAPVAPVAEPAVQLTLYIGLLKGDQMDAVVRDATALGVAALVPVRSAHVAVPRRAAPGEGALSRWLRIAAAAARQSGRAVVPVIQPAIDFETMMQRMATGTSMICVEPRHGREGAPSGVPPLVASLLVGPEGGWADEEVAAAIRSGATPFALGPRTLRADLTPVVALSALWTMWGWAKAGPGEDQRP